LTPRSDRCRPIEYALEELVQKLEAKPEDKVSGVSLPQHPWHADLQPESQGPRHNLNLSPCSLNELVELKRKSIKAKPRNAGLTYEHSTQLGYS